MSVYTEKELKFALNCDIYKFIQIPNIVDSSMYFKYLKKFKKKKLLRGQFFYKV